MISKASKLVLSACIVGAAACSPAEEAETPARTDRERDSLIGQSVLPGAQGVRGAMRVADSAAVRAARLDSIANAN